MSEPNPFVTTDFVRSTFIRSIEVGDHVGRRVRLRGWLHALRRLGGVSFLILRDGWGMVQIVAEQESELAPILEQGLANETVLAVEGEVTTAPQAPGGLEIRRPAITVLTPVAEPLPVLIGKREIKASLPTLLDHAVVANRHPARRALFR
ncbi:MAG TPA: OB-fold nucleic acid binding domain-containing protein, partial [Caldilineaceae bacterium]|nr:OB-fold nucleic acid binding domain-containing protein [Caldilineaceae bacterium]